MIFFFPGSPNPKGPCPWASLEDEELTPHVNFASGGVDPGPGGAGNGPILYPGAAPHSPVPFALGSNMLRLPIDRRAQEA